MTRFLLSAAAQRDLAEIRAYQRELPLRPANKIARKLQQTLSSIASDPFLGQISSAFTRLLGQEVRSRIAGPYRLYYRLTSSYSEIIAILHGARDHTAIMAGRLT